jgi:FtsH-binding integral membrane protein
MIDQDREHETYTEESPTYGLSKDLIKVLGIALGLLGFNIFLMILFSNTVLSSYTQAMFRYPIVGVIIFGILLTLGREIALRSSEKERFIGSLIGVSVLQFTYGIFGGSILSRFSSSIWGQSISLTILITLIITAIATVYVTNTNKDLSYLGKIASVFFLIGVVLALVGTFVQQVIIGAFIFFVVGFLIDLFYEIWLAVSSDRNTLSNGIAIYVAVTALFVHILQIILEYYGNQ